MNRILEHVAPQQDDDGVLLRRFLDARDDAAFAEIVARHGPMVYGVCLRLLGRCQDAEDAFQVAFLRLARNTARLREGDLGGWLYTVARRVSLTAVRGRRRRRWIFWEKTPEPEAKRAAEVDVDLDAAMATLSAHERSAVVLCHLEGRSRAEAAKALGIPEGTLSTRLAKALEKLRRKLGKPPMAVLAGAMVVMLPDSLPASTLGLVHHLRDGTLEDWAAPRMLDLYQKAFPMRLLDRLGPAVTSVVAALLVLVGAAFGWHMISAQQPKEDSLTAKSAAEPSAQSPAKKKSFASAVEEMQGGVKDAKNTTMSFVQLTISRSSMDDAKRFPWEIKVVEMLEGGKVEHSVYSWPAIEPLFKQIVASHTSIRVILNSDAVTRLEANQIVNLCKKSGFRSLDYTGPELFTGTPRDRWDAIVDDLSVVTIQVDLTQASGDLPDWTNGWVVDKERICSAGDENHRSNDVLETLVTLAQGERGPAAALAARLAELTRSNKGPVKTTELAKLLEERQSTKSMVRRTVNLTRNQGWGTRFTLNQTFKGGWIYSNTEDSKAIGALLERTAKAVGGGRFDVQIGSWDSLESKTTPKSVVNVLDVNLVLNSLKRGGVAEIHYTGQKLFTGQGEEAQPTNIEAPRPILNLVFLTQQLDGELPDPTNGWMQDIFQGWWFYKTGERERMQARMTPRVSTEEVAEVARLAKLPTNELEKELAKKPSLLRNRWRKDVEEAKKKSSPRTSQHDIKKVDDELAVIDEELAYMKWRLKPSQYERSAHVQKLLGSRDKLKGQMEKF